MQPQRIMGPGMCPRDNLGVRCGAADDRIAAVLNSCPPPGSVGTFSE